MLNRHAIVHVQTSAMVTATQATAAISVVVDVQGESMKIYVVGKTHASISARGIADLQTLCDRISGVAREWSDERGRREVS